MASDYTILITANNLVPLGDPIACWQTIDVTLRFNEPSSGSFTVPGFSWIRTQLIPGCRIVVIRNQQVLIAGPAEKWQYERSDDGDNAGDGMLTVNFSDDLALVVSRLTYPDPTLTPSAQVIDNWSFTGNGEVGLRTLVDANAGPSALAARRIPNLILGGLAGVGGSVTTTADRMEPLGAVMRRMAISAGGIGFRTKQVGTSIQFQVYDPSAQPGVIFGFGAGNLKYISYEVTAPTATTAVVGGQGEGSDRFLIERNNTGAEAQWGRMETLVNRPGSDPLADLQAAGDEELDNDKETARLPTSAADTANLRYGVDYDLGSLVSIETWPGSMLSDVVTSVHIQAWPTAGEVIAPTVGSQAESSDPKYLRQLRELDRRVGYLERNVMPATP